MKKSNSKYVIITLTVLLIGFSSCKQKRQIVHTALPVEQKENMQLFSDILSNQLSFHTFSSKISLTLSSKSSSRGSKARLQIVEDSALQISVQPLFGIEMFRLHVDADTLIFLDRMNKRFVKESIFDLKQHYPTGFDLKTLQALFCNRIFIAGKPVVDVNDFGKFIYTDTQNRYYLKSKDKDSDIDYSFSVNAEDRIVFTNLMDGENNYALQWNYSSFSKLSSKTFPYQMDITVGSTTKKAEMGIVFSDIELDQPITLSMNIPKGYKKAALADVLKILMAN